MTPSFNQDSYLEECIDSVLSQNYPNLEYIIMDGGSTDNSVEIIKKYEKYLTFWQSKPDGGQYAAINGGFRRTSGEIMTWLNSDDKFHPDAFLTVAAIFMFRNEVDWITGRSNTLNELGEQSWICEYIIPWSRLKYLKKEFKDPWIQQEGTFWRRRLWKRSGSNLRADLDLAGDLELWTRFFRFARLHTVDSLLAGFRFQPRSKTSLSMDKYLQEANLILDKEIQLFQDRVYQDLLSTPEPIEIAEIREALTLAENAGSDIAMNFCGLSGSSTLKSGLQRALEFYERSQELDPNNAKVRNSLGMLYWQRGEAKKAIEDLVQALRINPNFLDAVLNLGDILTKIKENEKAEKLYSSYLSMNPQNKDLFEVLASRDN